MPSPSTEPAGIRPALQVVLVADCSGSMTGERIGSLNYAARTVVPALQQAASDHPGTDVVVRVLRFSDQASWAASGPTPMARFIWSGVAAGGESRLGEALRLLAAEPPGGPGELAPVLVLLSDGWATDDARAGIDALAASAFGRDAVRVAIAIGSDADQDLLQLFVGDPGSPPLEASSAEMLVNRIRWGGPDSEATEQPRREAAMTEDRTSPAAASDGLVW